MSELPPAPRRTGKRPRFFVRQCTEGSVPGMSLSTDTDLAFLFWDGEERQEPYFDSWDYSAE